jgi:transposase InsO family protein
MQMATLLGVSRSGFYDWRDRPDSLRQQRRLAMAESVREVFDEHDAIYGSRKVAACLVDREVQICRNTTASLMRRMNLQSKSQRRRRFVTTTDSNHIDPIAGNTLNREFQAAAPNEKWVADITYIPTQEGWAYAAMVMDLFSRRIIGWSVGKSLETSLVLDALQDALDRRQPSGGLIHHSDRGCQYTSDLHRQILSDSGITCSMSRKGNCWDNACMESFMGSYKMEWMNHRNFATIESVRRETFRYVEIFYNRKRIHETLGYVSPCRYELNHYRSETAA